MEIERDFDSYFPGPLSFHRPESIFSQRVLEQLIPYAETVTGPLTVLTPFFRNIPQRQKDILGYLKDKKLISEAKVFFSPSFHDMPKPYICGLVPLLDFFPSDVDPGRLRQNVGTGVSFQFDRAVVKGVSEFLERYFFAAFRYADFVRKSQASLAARGTKFLAPAKLAGFSEEQKMGNEKLVFDTHSEFLWVTAKMYPAKEDIHVPAQIVFWGYSTFVFDEPFLREANAGGAAAAFSFEEALLYALRDLMERDAFLIRWLNTLTPSRVDQQSIDDKELVDILKQIRRYGFDLEILDVTSDIQLPVFAAVLLEGSDDARSSYVGVGCSSHLEQAIIHAIEEAFGIYVWHRRTGMRKRSLPESYQPFATKGVGRNDRKRLWANPDQYPHIRWFLQGPYVLFSTLRNKYPPSASVDEELRYLTDTLHAKGSGYEIYYHEVKNTLLDDMGYHVIKAIVPALVPLYLRGEANAPLGACRLREVPPLLGYQYVTFPNPFPHSIP